VKCEQFGDEDLGTPRVGHDVVDVEHQGPDCLGGVASDDAEEGTEGQVEDLVADLVLEAV
jgi:hypothetical protein